MSEPENGVRQGCSASSSSWLELPATRIQSTGQLVTAPCPWCGRSHLHGGGHAPEDGNGWRVPHCEDEYARAIRPGSYRIHEWGYAENNKEAKRRSGAYADRALISRLHPTLDRFSPLMRAIIKTLFPRARQQFPGFVAHIREHGLRLELWQEKPADQHWFGCRWRLFRTGKSVSGWGPARGSQIAEMPVASGQNLLQLLALCSGSPAGEVAQRLLFAATGIVLRPSTSALLQQVIDEWAGISECEFPEAFPGNPEFLFRLIGGGSKASSLPVPPLSAALFRILFASAKTGPCMLEYRHGRRRIDVSVRPSGSWQGRFPYPGSGEGLDQPVQLRGSNLLTLLSALSGIEPGWHAERILTAGLGLSLPAVARIQLADAITDWTEIAELCERDEEAS